jgi:glycosyltransferase involved in cell wall biosynthesis
MPPERSDPLRLCYVGWGDHVHLERWAGYFAATGHDVSILSLVPRAGRYPPGAREVRVGFENRGAQWRQLRMRWLLWQLRPQIVHVHWAHFAWDVSRVWRGPIVVTAWGSDIYKDGNFSPLALKRLRSGLAAAHAITCDSADLARVIAERVPEALDRIHVIQWGVDTGHFRPGERDSPLARSLQLGDGPVVLSPRNFTPLYNQETIVRAFRRVVDERPDAVLVFKDYHGDRGYREKVLALVRELGLDASVRVVETVPYEQMPDLYRLADVSVSVPHSDATPMSLLEAMACGSLPICSDLPSVREWIVDGANGYLVPVDDAAVLATRLLALLDSKEAPAMASTNRRIVEERASQRAHMARALDLYRSLLGAVRARDAA